MSARSRAGWYMRRLRSMGPAEALAHARRTAMHRADELRWRFAPGLWRRSWVPGDDVVFDSSSRTDSIGPLRPERIALLASRLPEERDRIVGAASSWLEGSVSVLGYEGVHLEAAGPGLDRDPFTGHRWPSRHGRSIDYRHSGVGDPKLAWELNRCQELPLLTLAWLLTDDERFAGAAEERLLRWVTAHPPGRGIAWANAYEPAVRAVSIAVAFDGLRGRRQSFGHLGAVERSLWQHGRWISRDLSSYSSANNHLIAELVGLLAISTFVPELADARRWRLLALDGLAREAVLQILPDGFGAEQSFAYWLYTIDLLLVAVALADLRGDAPPALREALSRASDALAVVVDVGEPDPAFGDDDDGRALILDGALERDARGVAASLAASVGHGGMRRLAGTLDPMSLLLFGSEGATRFDVAADAVTPGDAILRKGGLVVMRRESARLLFDVGPLGYLSIAAHGHADALQVDLSHGGFELIADPGTGSYFGDAELRALLRGTRAHATVSVDRLDQSEQGGPFLWVRHASSRLLAASLEDGYAVGEHDGYSGLEGPVVHRRAVVALSAGKFLVVDRLRSDAEHVVEQTWPLAPGLEPEVDGQTTLVSRSGRPVLLLLGAGSVSARTVASHDGRWSRRLESSEVVWTLRRRVRARDVELATLLVPLEPTSEPPPFWLELTAAGDEGVTTVAGGVGSTRFEVRLDLDVDPPRVLV